MGHPRVEVAHARSLLRAHVEREHWAATRVGRGATASTANSAARQHSHEEFNGVWGSYVEVRRRGAWKWCRLLTGVDPVDTDGNTWW